MHPINLISIFISGLNVGLALLIWLKNPKNKINILFALSVLCVAIWIFSEAMFREVQTESAARIWAYLDHLFGSAIVILFFFFTIYFPYQHLKLNIFFKILIAVSVVINLIIIFSPNLYLSEIILQPPFNDFILYPFGRILYSVFFITYLSIAFYFLIKKFFKSYGAMRKNLSFVLFSTGILALFDTIFGILPPLISGRDNPWFAAYFSLPMVILLAWFILMGDKKIYIK